MLVTQEVGYGYADQDWRLTLSPQTTPRFPGGGETYATLDLSPAQLAQINQRVSGANRGRVSLNYERLSLPIHPFKHRLFFVDGRTAKATYVGTFTILPIPDLRSGLERTVTSQVEVPPKALEALLESGRVRVVGVGVPLKGRAIPVQPVPFSGVSLTLEG